VLVDGGDPGVLEAARAAVEAELAAIDAAASRFRPDSELAAVNRAAGRATPVSDLLIEAVEVALRGARLTDGRVDPTIGRVVRLLGYDRDFASVAPDGPPLQLTARSVPGWQLVQVDRAAGTVTVPPGVELDLGSSAKALASDRAARAAGDAAAGVAGAPIGVLVGLGGDIAVRGPAPVGGWDVKVTDNHASPPDGPGQSISISSGGLATSGTTVRRWQRGEIALHHIVDPATGLPADTCWRTVSVAAASCVDANIASTAAIILGEAAPAWLTAHALPARLVRHDGTVTTVNGWPADEES